MAAPSSGDTIGEHLKHMEIKDYYMRSLWCTWQCSVKLNMIIDNKLYNNTMVILVIFCALVTTAGPYRHCSSYSYTSSWFTNRCDGKRACGNLLVVVFCHKIWKCLKIVSDLERRKLIRCCCCQCGYVTHWTAQGCGTPGTLCTSSYRTYWVWQGPAVQTILNKIGL